MTTYLDAQKALRGTAAVGGMLLGLLAAQVNAATTTVQAESFNNMLGIQTQATTDTGGGLNVGYTDAGDWISYPTLNLPCAGTYTVQYRVASAVTGSVLVLEKSGGGATYDTLPVPNTGGWQNWVTITRDITLPGGAQGLGIVVPAGGWNLNWFSLTDKCAASSSSRSSVAAGTNLRLQAEDYDEFFDTTAGNSGAAYRNDAVDIQALAAGGGFNVGWIVANEWLKFTDVVIPTSGQYTIRARVASPNTGAQFAVDLNSGATFLTNMVIPNTGDWQNFQTIQANVTIQAGTYDLGMFMAVGGFNLDWIEIVSGTNTSTPSSSSATSTSSSAPASQWKTAAQAATDMGAGFNLGNMFEGEQNASTFANAKPKIDAYYAKGFRNVRIPVTWTETINGSRLANQLTGVVDRNHPRLAQLQQTVDYALSLPGMHVVINAHHEYGLKDNNRAAVLERLWQDVVDIFGNRNTRLMFQLLNEPHLSDGSAMPVANIRAMSGRAYQKIRAVNPQRIVMIGGNQWFGSYELGNVWYDLSPVGNGNDPYIMASHHHYEPFTFSGQDGNHAMAWTTATIADPLTRVKNWADSVGKGMPVYVSEWGVGWAKNKPTMTCNNIRLWYQQMHSLEARSRNYPTAVWDDGGWFTIFSHATNSFNNNLVDCITGQCAWDGNTRINAGCY
ncbi:MULTISPECIES: carbohydrate-binding protein [Cellvibrio]|uniref:CBM6 domain-containing protein n=1 Tax=Cellvibrio fibrivorans TaxID=126350 RepID=A0ABU1V1B8_9GAMM|nr:carbohydrate-binding protein [Cellvibrio fibrivorans]MDR7091205.1 hypothetical protein [Cellvibrio fibrivorans]